MNHGLEVWVGYAEDNGWCDGCAYLHGSVWPAGVGPTKLHRHCRCQRRPVLPDRLGPVGGIKVSLMARANARMSGEIEREAELTRDRDLTPRRPPQPARVDVREMELGGALGWAAW